MKILATIIIGLWLKISFMTKLTYFSIHNELWFTVLHQKHDLKKQKNKKKKQQQTNKQKQNKKKTTNKQTKTK